MPTDSTTPDLDRPLTPRARDVVVAARVEFAARGYAGATTDAIARLAGVSQPYVVRLFGSKERLFLRCAREVQQGFVNVYRDAAAQHNGHPTREQLAAAFYDHAEKDPVGVKMMHQINSMGQEPELGAYARSWFVEMYSVLRNECHLSEEETLAFLARGTLISTLVSLGLSESDGEDAPELLKAIQGPQQG